MAKKKNSVDEIVGKRLREKRQDLGISTNELAAKAEVTPKELAEYEEGARRLRAATLLRIAKSLGVSVQYFFPAWEDEDVSHSGAGAAAFPEAGEALEVFEQRLRLNQAFAKIASPALRRIVVDLAAELAACETDDKS